ncbi:MAG: ribosome-recycling factor [Minisyncoccia bacterium]
MLSNELIKQFEELINLLIQSFKEEIMALRSSRPSSSQVENIKVECYNSQSLIKHLASISIVLPNIIIIEPWDQTIVQNIVKALSSSALGINPTVDGRQIKLFLPALTKERKEALVKILNSIKEEYRVRLRKNREEIINEIKKQQEDKLISEDDKFRLLDEVQKIIDKTNKILDEATENKEKEILES